MQKTISQRDARKLRRRVEELERVLNEQRRGWGSEWPGGTSIALWQWTKTDSVPTAIRTARRLKHAVVATVDDAGCVNFLALPLPK